MIAQDIGLLPLTWKMGLQPELKLLQAFGKRSFLHLSLPLSEKKNKRRKIRERERETKETNKVGFRTQSKHTCSCPSGMKKEDTCDAYIPTGGVSN